MNRIWKFRVNFKNEATLGCIKMRLDFFHFQTLTVNALFRLLDCPLIFGTCQPGPLFLVAEKFSDNVLNIICI